MDTQFSIRPSGSEEPSQTQPSQEQPSQEQPSQEQPSQEQPSQTQPSQAQSSQTKAPRAQPWLNEAAFCGHRVRLEAADAPAQVLFESDCVAGMTGMVEGCVDIVVTSPPYNLGIRYNSYRDSLPREEYLAWTERWASACRRVLSPGGSVFLNVGGKPSDPWIAMDIAGVFRKLFTLQNTFHWIKSIAVADRESKVRSFGHYKPISSGRFVNDAHEYVFHFTHAGAVSLDRLSIGVPYQDKSNIARWSGKADVRCRGNTWFIPYETIQSRARERPHPATFPVQLAEQCLKIHGLDKITLAMDPFLGIGSTGIACANLGLAFVGFEMDPRYFEVARQRIADAMQRRSPDASSPEGPAPDEGNDSEQPEI